MDSFFLVFNPLAQPTIALWWVGGTPPGWMADGFLENLYCKRNFMSQEPYFLIQEPYLGNPQNQGGVGAPNRFFRFLSFCRPYAGKVLKIGNAKHPTI